LRALYTAAKKKTRTIGGDTGEFIGQALSDHELRVTADAVKAAMLGAADPDRKALSRVLARLTMAYKWKAANAR
jgi:hypothetical protein